MKNFVILLLSGVHLIKHSENQQMDLATIYRFQKHVAAFYNIWHTMVTQYMHYTFITYYHLFY